MHFAKIFDEFNELKKIKNQKKKTTMFSLNIRERHFAT